MSTSAAIPGSRLQTGPAGVIGVQPFALPLSAALSPEAAQAQAAALAQGGGLPDFSAASDEAQFKTIVDGFRQGLEAGLAPIVARLHAEFPVRIEGQTIGGVPVEEFSPEGADDTRVLIHLHGGGFLAGGIPAGRVESIPVSHLGKYRVVSVQYRHGYEHRYPAASEDVEAVYRALLDRYPAQKIGMFGGSSGGTLAAQSIAWMLARGLPAPGALAMLCAGTGGAGDASYFAAIGTGIQPPVDSFAALRQLPYGYFAATDPQDICINPILAPLETRAKFPPSFLLTGTRASDMSAVLATHRALVQAGVDAQLHVFDGMGHCFYSNIWLPEGADAYASLIRFFAGSLG
jgi:epsilon-lactone hydrolase